jgi:hypothetical protein
MRAASPGHRSIFFDLVLCGPVSFVPHLEFFLVDSSCSALLISRFTGLRFQRRARAPLSSFRSSVGPPQNPPHWVSRHFMRPPRSALRSPGFSCCLQVRHLLSAWLTLLEISLQRLNLFSRCLECCAHRIPAVLIFLPVRSVFGQQLISSVWCEPRRQLRQGFAHLCRHLVLPTPVGVPA